MPLEYYYSVFESTYFPLLAEMVGRRTVTVLGIAVVLGLGYRSIRPPPPSLAGSPNGPPVTSPRIRLSDGRHLAYKESGVPKDKARFKIITVHGFGDSKDFALPTSQEVVDELGVYFLSFDRAGYGESDPNPKRDVKSEAMDIQQLADQLEIGSKFYVIGFSMGGYATWACLKYIPHRLAGVAMVAPVVNYWWPSFPGNLSKQVFNEKLLQDQRTFWIAHHAPFLMYWWMTQKWFPTLSALEGHPDALNEQDKEFARKAAVYAEQNGFQHKARQQGDFESLYRDLMVGFGRWEFDPMNMSNPYPQNEANVHIWQGSDDRLVPPELQRFVAKKLPWIQYHEVPEGGHLFFYANGLSDAILESLVHGQTPAST